MRLIIGILLLGAFAATESQAATETLYVRHQPSVALRVTPAPDGAVVRELTPGDAVAVLGRQAGYVEVSLADGTRGWLPEAEVTAVAPPAARVAILEGEVDALRSQLATAQSELQSTQTALRQARQAASAARSAGADETETLVRERDALRGELDSARAQLQALGERIGQLELAQEAARLLAERQPTTAARVTARFSPGEIAIGFSVLTTVLLLGAWLGLILARRRLRQRYHGLEL